MPAFVVRALARLEASRSYTEMLDQTISQSPNNGSMGSGFLGALQPKGRASVDVVTIDKTAAEQLLALNYGRNRRIKNENLRRFVKTLENGEFVVGSQIVVVYDDNGAPVLTDGQHRLQAIVQTGIPAVMSVLRVNGSAHKDYLLRDMYGSNRTAADAAFSEGVGVGMNQRQIKTYMAAVKLVISNFSRESDRLAKDMPREKLIDVAREFLQAHERLVALVGQDTDLRTGLLAVALVTMEHAPFDVNEAFWPNVIRPNMIANSDPRMKLFEWMAENRVIKGHNGIARFAVATATAWNYHVDGFTLSKIYANKAMPKIKLTPYPVSDGE